MAADHGINFQFGQSQDSMHAAPEDGDRLSAGGNSSDGHGSSSAVGSFSYAAYPYPLGAGSDSELHDPFFPSPAPSPSLVQQVLHQSNAQGFSIIPLTVHSNSITRRATSSERGGVQVRGELGANCVLSVPPVYLYACECALVND